MSNQGYCTCTLYFQGRIFICRNVAHQISRFLNDSFFDIIQDKENEKKARNIKLSKEIYSPSFPHAYLHVSSQIDDQIGQFHHQLISKANHSDRVNLSKKRAYRLRHIPSVPFRRNVKILNLGLTKNSKTCTFQFSLPNIRGRGSGPEIDKTKCACAFINLLINNQFEPAFNSSPVLSLLFPMKVLAWTRRPQQQQLGEFLRSTSSESQNYGGYRQENSISGKFLSLFLSCCALRVA